VTTVLCDVEVEHAEQFAVRFRHGDQPPCLSVAVHHFASALMAVSNSSRVA
jgi:hypothetical protein